ncbi:unnamed protein product [Spirodela intermedia]|uniref:Uncharacterized protein n=1 Tax=Spirodela intermedia TaxID=51605 RepID=A0A7I8KRV6_SPIIN|nr:unnamed protein product [Spirodela intermedia]
MKMPSGSKIERRSSVEREPKTLTTQELQCAREGAIQILRTNTLEEAVRIFTEVQSPGTSSAFSSPAGASPVASNREAFTSSKRSSERETSARSLQA